MKMKTGPAIKLFLTEFFKMFSKNIFLIIIVIISIAFIVFAIWLNFKNVNAQKVLPTLPFGGRIVRVINCTCSYGHVVQLAPLNPTAPGIGGSYHFTPLTRLYSFFQTKRIGALLLGNYIPGTGRQCLVLADDDCFPVINKGTMNIVGTSL